MKMLNNLRVNLRKKKHDTFTTHSLNNGFQYKNIYNLIAESKRMYNVLHKIAKFYQNHSEIKEMKKLLNVLL